MFHPIRMIRSLSVFLSLVIFLQVGFAQTASADKPSPLSFEVASIHPSKSMDNGTSIDIDRGGGEIRLRFENLSLQDCIREAYKVKDYQISGPSWLKSERYDITAKAPAQPENKDAWRIMLQNLLAERFHLSLHLGSKEMPVYALIAGNGGTRLQKADPSGSFGISGRNSQYTFTRISMPRFAEFLSGNADRAVQDMTQLTGEYDFKLQFVRETLTAPTDSSSESATPPLFTALQEQLGLKLIPRKAPLDILVIDHVEQTPTEN